MPNELLLWAADYDYVVIALLLNRYELLERVDKAQGAMIGQCVLPLVPYSLRNETGCFPKSYSSQEHSVWF